MSQTSDVSALGETPVSTVESDADEYKDIISSTSPDTLSNSNDDWKSIDNIHVVTLEEIHDQSTTAMQRQFPTHEQTNDDTWANFNASEHRTDQHSGTDSSFHPAAEQTDTASNMINDHWADFKSQLPNDKPTVNPVQDDDVFGDFSEVQATEKTSTSNTPSNTVIIEQLESLISTCFPLEATVHSSTAASTLACSELPSFTTCQSSAMKQYPCFTPTLSLWQVLLTVSNDPIGVRYQWRQSTTERLFHQAMGVTERTHDKTRGSAAEFSVSENGHTSILNVNDDVELFPIVGDPFLHAKRSDSGNRVTMSHIDRVDQMDSRARPISAAPSHSKEALVSSAALQRNHSPSSQSQRVASIKTMDLDPGSSKLVSDDMKPSVNPIPNFSSMNPKALLYPVQLNGNHKGESANSS